MTASISGLVSGLNTSSIISQMMQIEAQPRTALKNRVSTDQTQLKALQDLNSSVLALYNSATNLTKPSSWQGYTATSSSQYVAATTTSTAAPGTLSFTVNSLATAQSDTFANSANLTDPASGASTTVQLTIGGNTVNIDTGDGSLQGLVNGINTANAGVHASTTKLTDGTYRLTVSADQTGTASAFTLTDSSGAPLLGGATVTAGQDASITAGADTLTSSSNVFTGVFSGVDVTLGAGTQVGDNVTISVAQDSAKVGDQIQSLVDQVNKVLSQIDKDTAYDSTNKSQGVLGGETSLETLRSAIVDSVFPGGTSSMADYGVQVDRYGKLTFDRSKFDAAYAAGPAATQAAFTDGTGNGFTYRLAAAADLGSNAGSGVITTAISGRNSSIKDLQTQIDSWDTRLALKQQMLEQQFNNLETVMGQMKSQSDWLTSQLSSLPTSSSLSSSTSTSGS
jgi:flagellar hook-associated protein 2